MPASSLSFESLNFKNLFLMPANQLVQLIASFLLSELIPSRSNQGAKVGPLLLESVSPFGFTPQIAVEVALGQD